jgi:hypothetical protein
MFSADLQILPLPPNIPKLQSLVFSEIKKFPEYPGIEINLLDDYEVDGKIKFYLEPNDTYHLTTPIVLSKGLYIATLTFLGKKYKEEFWRRRFVFKVPSNSGTNATA